MNVRRSRGFSLLELALGLSIVAVMLSALLVPLATQVEQRRTEESRRLLEEAREALIGFAIGNRRFPCPATGTNGGREFFRQTAPAGGAANGLCEQYRGFLPARDLGLSPLDANGYLLDGFGTQDNRVRYAVADVQWTSTNNRVYTAAGGMAGLGIDLIAASSNRLTVCNRKNPANDVSCPSDPGDFTLSSGDSIVIVWSAGKEPGSRSTDEARNNFVPDASDNTVSTNQVFVSRTQSDKAGSEFDDMLLWVSPNILIARMVAAGRLP